MTLRDRGKLKWQGAFFMPEHVKMPRDMKTDYHRQAKPIIDEYEIDEFDRRICYAMEFNLAVKLTCWYDGFNEDICGRIHYMDPINQEVRLVTEEEAAERVKFADIVAVSVIE
ncbi:YolD-like family protein [Peribacillus saganii]|uniref:YolD-like family protein n=1 Tax=Peribacillus saganii TaxID=2303992 RepID=A0A372LCK1_9BACI|nr:YolD-like family protein [Peribacillus saganii]RFU63681.1 YolD-like family protein [Peribacillus saganii]